MARVEIQSSGLFRKAYSYTIYIDGGILFNSGYNSYENARRAATKKARDMGLHSHGDVYDEWGEGPDYLPD